MPKNTHHLLKAECAKSPTEHKGVLVSIWSGGYLPTFSLDHICNTTYPPLDVPQGLWPQSGLAGVNKEEGSVGMGQEVLPVRVQRGKKRKERAGREGEGPKSSENIVCI